MAKIAGKYKADKLESFDEYFKNIGVPEAEIQGVKKATDEIEIKVDDSSVVLKTPVNERTFPLDKEIDEDIGKGVVLKSTASIDGDRFTIKSKGDDGRHGKRVYELSGSDGLLLSFSTEGISPVGKIYYKRV